MDGPEFTLQSANNGARRSQVMFRARVCLSRCDVLNQAGSDKCRRADRRRALPAKNAGFASGFLSRCHRLYQTGSQTDLISN